jgi:hypothetical protein
MSGIISYPVTTPELDDLLLGTEIEANGNITKNFRVSEVIDLAKEKTLESGISGSFFTTDILQITIVDGLITNVQTAG